MTTTSQSYAGASLLLIEDNDCNRQLMQDFLSQSGYRVTAIAEGQRFAAAFQQSQPQLILLDLKLLDMDGYDLLAQIQQHPLWQRVPVVVVSAYAFRRDRQRALQLGARHYLVKPLKLMHLLAVITETLTLVDRYGYASWDGELGGGSSGGTGG